MKSNVLIPLLVLLPLLSGLALALVPGQTVRSIRRFALLGTLITFVASLLAAYNFDWSGTAIGMQLDSSIVWIEPFGLHFGFGVDSVSMWLVLLTTFLMPPVVLGSYTAVTERHREFFAWLLVLEAAMIGTFVATDVIFFYICFEFTLIPLYFLIGIFGSTQRLKAARVFFIYTFTGSMLTFAGVLYVAWWHSLDYGWSFSIKELTAAAQTMSGRQQHWVLLALLAGFAVKVPLFPLHTWLPLAHTEAPTAGSVVLAGVLLKLGTYGLLRFALPMCPDAAVAAAPTIGVLAVIGILYTALICWAQRDIKKLIAYSSVSHLGFCVLGMFAMNAEGLGGSVMYMVNHGLSTGALFLCVGMIYERFHTRQMSQLGGLARAMPVWSFFMVFFCLASVGLPGLNGFVGEFLTLLGAFRADGLLGRPYAIAAGFGIIVAAIYILYMVGRVVFGPLNVPAVETAHASGDEGHAKPRPRDLNGREIITLAPLAAACLWFGLFPNTMLGTLDQMTRDLEVRTVSVQHDMRTWDIGTSKTGMHARRTGQGRSDGATKRRRGGKQRQNGTAPRSHPDRMETGSDTKVLRPADDGAFSIARRTGTKTMDSFARTRRDNPAHP